MLSSGMQIPAAARGAATVWVLGGTEPHEGRRSDPCGSLLVDGRRQALATVGAPALDDVAATGGGHACTETVGADALGAGRLVRTKWLGHDRLRVSRRGGDRRAQARNEADRALLDALCQYAWEGLVRLPDSRALWPGVWRARRGAGRCHADSTSRCERRFATRERNSGMIARRGVIPNRSELRRCQRDRRKPPPVIRGERPTIVRDGFCAKSTRCGAVARPDLAESVSLRTARPAKPR